MRVTLINPTKTMDSKSSNISKAADVGLPLATLFVAATLDRAGHDVTIIDSLVNDDTVLTRKKDEYIGEPVAEYGIPWDTLIRKVQASQPDWVGISSLFTAQLRNPIKIVELLHEQDPSLPIVMGGPHLAVQPAEFLNEVKGTDLVVVGEGDITAVEIAEMYEGKRERKDVAGIAYRDKDGTVVRTAPRPYIMNLDELPYPAYHLINMEAYLRLPEKGIYCRTTDEYRCISLLTSRGCPYTCTFCSVHLSMGRRYRANSAEYALAHIRHVYDEHGVRQLHIEDDNFTLNMVRAGRIFDGIIENKLEITWDTPNGIRADLMTPEFAQKMKKSGCKRVTLAIESGNQEVLNKLVKKSLDLNKVEQTAKVLYEAGIPTAAFYVIGFPGETKEQINDTIKFALSLQEKYGVSQGGAFIATPLIGTELYDMAVAGGYLAAAVTPETLRRATASYGQGLIKTEEFDPEYLRNVNQKLIRSNYLRQLKNPWPHVRDLAKNPAKAVNIAKRFAGV